MGNGLKFDFMINISKLFSGLVMRRSLQKENA